MRKQSIQHRPSLRSDLVSISSRSIGLVYFY